MKSSCTHAFRAGYCYWGTLGHSVANAGRAMILSPVQRLTDNAQPTPASVVTREANYAKDCGVFLQQYYTVFDEVAINDELAGLAKEQRPILACAAQDVVFVDHLRRIATIVLAILIETYGPRGIARPELQTAAFAKLVRSNVNRTCGCAAT